MLLDAPRHDPGERVGDGMWGGLVQRRDGFVDVGEHRLRPGGEAEAYLRIAAARASRRYPVLLTMLEDGRLHLSGIAVLTSHLDELSDETREELLARATHKTKREIEVLVAEVAPKPDVPPSIRKVPERRQTAEERVEATNRQQLTPSRPSSTVSTGSAGEPARMNEKERDPREEVEPLSAARYKVQFTTSAEFPEWLKRLAALTPGADIGTMIETAVKERVQRLEGKRYGKVKNPRKRLEDADTSAGVRGITAPVKRFVWERDRAQCAFVSEDGRRCPERHGLEFDHVEAFGLGGDRNAPNIRLLCRQHNQYVAEKTYGRPKMDQYRRPADRVREPSPSFDVLFPDAVTSTFPNASTLPLVAEISPSS